MGRTFPHHVRQDAGVIHHSRKAVHGPLLSPVSVEEKALTVVSRCVGSAALVGLVCHAAEPPAAQWSGDDYKNLTLRRHRTCVENEQYLQQGLCCLNCQAECVMARNYSNRSEGESGTDAGEVALKSQNLCCIKSARESRSRERVCPVSTEDVHGALQRDDRCLPCTHCRSDEIVTAPCSTTTDTRCQCKSGTFCVPDQACEVCKRCARCKPGEEESAENGIRPRLKRLQPPPSPTPASSADIVTPVCISLAILFILIALAVWWLKRRSCETPCLTSHCDSSEIVKIPIDESGATAEERQNDQNAGLGGGGASPRVAAPAAGDPGRDDQSLPSPGG
ncbi:hypothetical protein KUCAC02_008537 [Chaenocephalus aceratus]|uniref:Uncharacterized protein n=1 Tax=Chaenocephalus aceratus TaxID=36190 RepID=A0ACB9WSB4_CHAAC|nr:hypothetical protein KUCAC02_008537 [Chaenocephalus aceratus]